MQSKQMMMDTGCPWTIADVARYLGYSQRYTYQLAREGELPGRKVRGRWYFNPQAIRDYVGIMG